MNRVLIADDEKLSLNGIASIVNETDGFETAALAGNGLQAFELVREERPDILITDIRMPQKDGIWLIEQVDEAGLDLPVIVISAYDDQKYLKTAIRSRNVYDYLFKPFMKEELQDTLKSIISYHKQNKETHDEDIGIVNLQKAISANDFSLIDKQLDEYFDKSTENISDLKNRIYGWIMYVDHGVFPVSRSIPLYTRNAMKEVYESTDKKQLQDVIKNYLKDC
ncbi:MAG: response regulator, partial [Erysipelotrichaceae bacterium]|nr:response regulator [Erysipelotrichaceae bacterium]